MTYCTYIHIKKDTNEVFYVGKGMVSRSRAQSRCSRSKHWHNVVSKHGLHVEVISHWRTEEEAFEHERFLISCFRDMGAPLVNLTDGGDGTSGWKHSEEFKIWQSEKVKKDNKNPEISAKRTAAQKNRFITKESREKLSLKVKSAWTAEKRAAASQRALKQMEKSGPIGRNTCHETKLKIFSLRSSGMLMKNIAKEVGIHKQTVGKILRSSIPRSQYEEAIRLTSARIKSGHATIDLVKTIGTPTGA